MDRRTLIKSIAGLGPASAIAATDTELTSRSVLPTTLSPVAMPTPIRRGGLAFLTADEAATVGAIFERLIPTDALGAGARDAGCVDFIDRQLAGDFGRATAIYRRGPIVPGTPQQGPQFRQTPAERYRSGLLAIDKQATALHGKCFVALTSAEQDAMLRGIETGAIALGGPDEVDGKAFFALLLSNVREGYFADPMYGGNKDMVGWKLVGFPGARYDYREAIVRKGQKLDYEPVSILGRSAT